VVEFVKVSDPLASNESLLLSVVASVVVAVVESVEVDSVVVSLVDVSSVSALASKLPMRLLASTPPSAVTANTPVTNNGFARANAIGFAPSCYARTFALGLPTTMTGQGKRMLKAFELAGNMVYHARMTEFAPDELRLTGRIQVEIAAKALDLTGLNDGMLRRLLTFLNVYDNMPDATENSPLHIYVRGEKIVGEKQDMVASLELLGAHVDTLDDVRLAAIALRDIL
jgi:hypothetical protein